MEQGIEKGLQEGEKKKPIEIALKILKEGLPVQQVSKLTGLSIEEIQSIPT